VIRQASPIFLPVDRLQRMGGPPKTGWGIQLQVRLQPPQLGELDGWIAKQDDQPGRSEAIRRLVELGLKAKR
jgi:hypothetical protein